MVRAQHFISPSFGDAWLTHDLRNVANDGREQNSETVDVVSVARGPAPRLAFQIAASIDKRTPAKIIMVLRSIPASVTANPVKAQRPNLIGCCG
jgi:hypothetical protein